MDTQQKLDRSSPIVQRVLRLRERIAQYDASATKVLTSAEAAPAKKSYQWQMWQKSDFSAYAGDESGHRCKE